MCVEAVAGAAEVKVILDICDSSRPFLSVQTPYLFVKFTHPAPDYHFSFSFTTSEATFPSLLASPEEPTTITACAGTQQPSATQIGCSSRKRSRPVCDDEDDLERPEKRRRLRLQIAFSKLSSPYAYPPAKKGFPCRPVVLGRPGFQVIGRGKLQKIKGDLIRKTAILNKMRRDRLARDQETKKIAEDKKQDILQQHRTQFEGYWADPLRNPPPSAEILEERWDADDIPRYEDDQPDENEEFPWHLFQ
ncbi:hypothetical protein DRE_02313 [Drechslerella stenobrocha 248]|uniref:Uncharacterized protein n=1 Tax=Drechslerella stenobrocha 248 TaxID=1043628 RepID=W7HXG5_9PEZI|nr:hypothetical protein DRE_02313 [Drechslerella stenobrocha 248]